MNKIKIYNCLYPEKAPTKEFYSQPERPNAKLLLKIGLD